MPAPQPVFRFAPSPNGRLHLGHAYSALLNQRMAQEMGGRLLLRVEDTDQTRCRQEYVDGILEDLRWLGLTWEEPVRVQSKHFADYDSMLARLWNMGAIYPCFCSRKRVQTTARDARDPDGQPHYGGPCRGMTRQQAEARMAAGEPFGWRLITEGSAASEWGEVIIAKRHVGSSYHVAVVTDDALQGVTNVVRGKDMEAATSIHRLLQKHLDLPQPEYLHHDLILDDAGQKLSKSIQSKSIANLRDEGVTAPEIRAHLGFS